jgi:Tfp pilus assembly protein PilO
MIIEKKTNISIVIFLSLIILINVFVVYPLLNEIKNNSQWLVSEKDRFLTLNEKIDNLKNFDVSYQDREETLKQIDDLFIDSEVPVDFISFLEKTGKQSSVNVEITPFSVGKNNKDSWPFLNFQVTISGPFPSFLMFLEKIENSPYLIEIQNLTISQSAEAKQSPGNIKALLSFKAFSK